jgi:hypothetical protein
MPSVQPPPPGINSTSDKTNTSAGATARLSSREETNAPVEGKNLEQIHRARIDPKRLLFATQLSEREQKAQTWFKNFLLKATKNISVVSGLAGMSVALLAHWLIGPLLSVPIGIVSLSLVLMSQFLKVERPEKALEGHKHVLDEILGKNGVEFGNTALLYNEAALISLRRALDLIDLHAERNPQGEERRADLERLGRLKELLQVLIRRTNQEAPLKALEEISVRVNTILGKYTRDVMKSERSQA